MSGALCNDLSIYIYIYVTALSQPVHEVISWRIMTVRIILTMKRTTNNRNNNNNKHTITLEAYKKVYGVFPFDLITIGTRQATTKHLRHPHHTRTHAHTHTHAQLDMQSAQVNTFLNQDIMHYLVVEGFLDRNSDLTTIARLNHGFNKTADRRIWSTVVIDLNDTTDKPEHRLQALLNRQPGADENAPKRAENILTSLSIYGTTKTPRASFFSKWLPRTDMANRILKISRRLESLKFEVGTSYGNNILSSKYNDGDGDEIANNSRFNFTLRTLTLSVWWDDTIKTLLESQPSITSLEVDALMPHWLPGDSTASGGSGFWKVNTDALPALENVSISPVLFPGLIHGQTALKSLSIVRFDGWMRPIDVSYEDLNTSVLSSLEGCNIHEIEAMFRPEDSIDVFLLLGSSLPHLRLLSDTYPATYNRRTIMALPEVLDELEGFRITLCHHTNRIPGINDIKVLGQKCRALKDIVVSVIDGPASCANIAYPFPQNVEGPSENGHFLWRRVPGEGGEGGEGGEWAFSGLFSAFDYVPGRDHEDFASCCKGTKEIGTENDPRWAKGWTELFGL